MNKKSIKKVLNQKFTNFVESIDDENVKKLVKTNSIITGGCIASMLLGEKINDYDIYFTNKETVIAVSEYYLNKMKQNGSYNSVHLIYKGKPGLDDFVGEDERTDEFVMNQLLGDENCVKIYIQSSGVMTEGNVDIMDIDDVGEYTDELTDTTEVVDESTLPKYRPIHISSNAITLSNKIQLVIRFYGEATEIHSNYDFIHCTNYWTSNNKQLVLNQPALEAILSKELVYSGSKYPIASMIRTRKFLKREKGWWINAGQYLKMAIQINALDLKNVNVLEDQLMGVDAAYFSIITEAVRKAMKKEDFKLTDSYLISLIDTVF